MSHVPAKELLKVLEGIDLKVFTDELYDDFPIPRSAYENALLALQEYKEKKTVVDSYPPALVIEVTNHCNLRCPLCPTGIGDRYEPRGYMDLGLFKDICDQSAGKTTSMWLTHWGEPTLHKQFFEFVEHGASKEFSVCVASNFARSFDDSYFDRLVDSGLQIIHIDMDGVTQETYEKYRVGGNLATVQRNIARLCEAKKRYNSPLRIEIGMLVFRHNEHEIEDFKKFCADLDIDEYIVRKIKTDPTVRKDLLPVNRELTYDNYFDESAYPEDHRCPRIYFTLPIEWTGLVVPCCVVFGSHNQVGDVRNQSVMEVWNNENFVSIRSLFTDTPRGPVTLCNYCRNKLGSAHIPRQKGTMALSLPRNEKNPYLPVFPERIS